MAVEDTHHDDVRLHRPLPSIGIPLLREERRALRARQVALAAGVLGIVAIAAGTSAYLGYTRAHGPNVEVTALSPSDDERTPNSDDGEEAGRAEAPPPGQGSDREPAPDRPVHRSPAIADAGLETHAAGRTVRAFGTARGFRDAVVRAGASRDEGAEIEHAMTGVMDFRRCRPEDQLIFERDPRGTLVAFEYHNGPLEFFRAERARGELRGRRVEVPIERHRLVRAGVVQSSLGDALDTAGLGRALVGAFVEAFEGTINFTSHTRSGDTFRIIVDEERIDGRFLRYSTPQALEYSGQRTGTHRAIWFEPSADEGDYYDPTGRAIHGGWLRAPVRYDRISSRFDPRRLHPILRRVVPHNGMDYAAGSGTPVWAAANGVVTFAGERGANGNLVSIRHDGGYETFYAHLSRIERGVRSGETVRQRQVIGYVGSTGRSTGPHLHFGLKRNGRFVDPLRELNAPGRMLPGGMLGRFQRHARTLTNELDRVGRGARHPAPNRAQANEPEEDDTPQDEALD